MFEASGDLIAAATYAKVYEQVIDLLEQMAEILGEEKLSYDDFLSCFGKWTGRDADWCDPAKS